MSLPISDENAIDVIAPSGKYLFLVALASIFTSIVSLFLPDSRVCLLLYKVRIIRFSTGELSQLSRSIVLFDVWWLRFIGLIVLLILAVLC